MRNLIIAILFATASLAAQAEGYYKINANVMASAATQGDQIFAEMVTNLPPSDVVGAPESIAVRIYGSCSLRQYTIQGTAFFSEKMRGGYIMDQIEGDSFRRRIAAGSAVAKLFDKECSK